MPRPLPPRPLLPRVIGHRGAARHAPENTLAGLQAAARLGVAWVEFDVMLTQDGHPVLLHDDSLARTTGLARLLCDTPLAEARRLDAGAWFGPAFAGQGIPTLEEAFAALAQLGLGANIEIKPAPGFVAETARATVETTLRAWPANLPPPLLSSFEVGALEVAQELAPDLARGYLVEELPPDWQATAERLGCVSVHPWTKPLTRPQVEAIKAAGYLVAVYTVNEGARARELLAWGADSIITDDPPALGL
jgi:glycerophosphoryl diester phosphodiesterase